MSEYLYTTSEASKILDVSDRHVRRLCERLSVQKEGRSFVISEKNLLELQNIVSSEGDSKKDMMFISVDEYEELKEYIKELESENHEIRGERKMQGRFIEALKSQVDDLTEELEPYKQAEEDEKVLELFTKEEFQQFEKILKQNPINEKTIEGLTNEVKILSNQLDYFRDSMRSKEEQLNKVLDAIIQRNYIEAKDKGFE